MYQDELEDIQHSLLLMSSLQDKSNAHLITHAVFYLVYAVRRLAYSVTVPIHVLPNHCVENRKTFGGLLLPLFCPGVLLKCAIS